MTEQYPTNQYNTSAFTASNRQLALDATAVGVKTPTIMVDEAPTVLRFFNPNDFTCEVEVCTVASPNGVEVVQPYYEHGAPLLLSDSNTIATVDIAGTYKLRIKDNVNAGLSGVFVEAIRSKIPVTPSITIASQGSGPQGPQGPQGAQGPQGPQATVMQPPSGMYAASLVAAPDAWQIGATPYKRLVFTEVVARVDNGGVLYNITNDTFNATSARPCIVMAEVRFVPTGNEDFSLIVMNTTDTAIVASAHYKGNPTTVQAGDEAGVHVHAVFTTGRTYAVMLVSNGVLPDVVRQNSRLTLFAL